MPTTYEALATTTLASETATITFSSISSAYTDLRLVLVAMKSTAANVGARVQFNGDTSSNYSWTSLAGNGSAASSSVQGNDTSLPLITFSVVTTTSPHMGTLDIFSYAGSTNKTSLITESSDRNGSGATVRYTGLWRSTSAITSIRIFDDSARNFGVGTMATLYGIKNA
jgi:archaellum component FlaF (FlaF/FlaG flagellin family)